MQQYLLAYIIMVLLQLATKIRRDADIITIIILELNIMRLLLMIIMLRSVNEQNTTICRIAAIIISDGFYCRYRQWYRNPYNFRSPRIPTTISATSTSLRT